MIVKKLLYCGFFRSVLLTSPLFRVISLIKENQEYKQQKLINELQ